MRVGTPEVVGAAQAPVSPVEIFLSYSRENVDSVHRIAVRLKQEGVEPWFDRWSLTPGGDWQQELSAGLARCSACAVFIGRGHVGAWVRQEVAVALERAVKDRAFRVFPVLLPGRERFDPETLPPFLRTRTWVDFRRGIESASALQDLIHAVKGLPFGPDVAIEPREDVCPYLGLRTFDERDADLYFGREAEVQRILEKLKAARMLGVVGPSGSGKSSLVRAGVVAALRAGGLVGSDGWPVRVMRPGAHPVRALAAALVSLSGETGMRATVAALADDARTLENACVLALGSRDPERRLVLVVDQLEEVFTLCSDRRQRDALFANLLFASTVPGGKTIVLATLRADFYPRLAAFRELAQALGSHHMLVAPLDDVALRQVIEQPALHVGLRLEAGLRDSILADVDGQSGALPLLSHAMLETWRRRRGGVLTLEGYRAGGGVRGAIAERAESVYGELTSPQRTLARRVLLRLTEPGEGTEDTRRRASLGELGASQQERDAVEAVVGRLVDARLLTTGRDAETADAWVEVSHEALIRGWPRLRRWIDEDREGLRVHRRITESAQQWENERRPRSLLYRGSQLDRALELRRRRPDDLNDVERAFVAAGARRRSLARAATGSAAALGVAALVWLALPDVRAYVWKREALGQSPSVAFPAGPATLGGGGDYGHRDRRRLRLGAFEIDRHEVTNAQYRLCMRAGACSRPIETTGAERSYEEADPKAPVVFVTGLQSAEFCAWLGRRLPTDAEWERAARGADGRRWPRARRPRPADVNTEGSKGLAAVEDRRFAAGSTDEDLTHMVGNAAEWTGTPDKCPPNPYACATRWDGPKPATLILRGGGFIDPAMPLDGSDNDISDSGEKWNYVGFRCARSQ